MKQPDNERSFDPRLPFATTVASASARQQAAARTPRPSLRVVCEVDGSAADGLLPSAPITAALAAAAIARERGVAFQVVERPGNETLPRQHAEHEPATERVTDAPTHRVADTTTPPTGSTTCLRGPPRPPGRPRRGRGAEVRPHRHNAG